MMILGDFGDGGKNHSKSSKEREGKEKWHELIKLIII